jgi:hypothetical protein
MGKDGRTLNYSKSPDQPVYHQEEPEIIVDNMLLTIAIKILSN